MILRRQTPGARRRTAGVGDGFGIECSSANRFAGYARRNHARVGLLAGGAGVLGHIYICYIGIYVHAYMYMCMYFYLSIYPSIHIYVYIYIHTYIHTYIYDICMHTYMHTYIDTLAPIVARACI